MLVKVRQYGTFEGFALLESSTYFYLYLKDLPKDLDYYQQQLQEKGYFDADLSYGHVIKHHEVEKA